MRVMISSHPYQQPCFIKNWKRTMNAEKRLAQSEAIEMARWLSPLPELQSKLAPDLKAFAQGEADRGVGNAFGTDGSSLPDFGSPAFLGKLAICGSGY